MTTDVDVQRLIHKKRTGETLTTEELEGLVRVYVEGIVPDYQMSAFAMAVCLQGMSDEETTALTLAMAHSGDTLDLASVPGIPVDKHSTGGVADTTTLVLAPLAASIGIPVAKMSGRGLGHTGGTIDKLESIPGFSTQLSTEEFLQQVRDIGVAVTAQTGNLAPADKKLYALRDVTDTVQSIPLISSSIMSKKLASGAKAIVLDVKVGSGAFMKTESDARKLAQTMVNIGELAHRPVTAVLTRMDEPLSRAVGNALEVREAILTLRGQGSPELRELCLVLGSEMAVLAGKVKDAAEGRRLLEEALSSGAALTKFKEFVKAQHGDARVADDLSLLPQAQVVEYLRADEDGTVLRITAEELGLAAMHLGAGRAHQDDIIDASVGIILHRKTGQSVVKGEVLAEIHANSKASAQAALQTVRNCIVIGGRAAEAKQDLVIHTIRPGNGNGRSHAASGQRGELKSGVANDRRLGRQGGQRDRTGEMGEMESLLQQAATARQRAHVPYSHFAVGAALRLADGQVFTGANIENASFSLTNCAERTAVFAAVMDGLSDDNAPAALAVTADSKGPVAPCGACRQVLAEFCDKNMPVYLGDSSGATRVTTVGELLPYAFDRTQMPADDE